MQIDYHQIGRGFAWRNYYLRTLRQSAVYSAASLSIQRQLSRWQNFCSPTISIATPTALSTRSFSNSTSSANQQISSQSVTNWSDGTNWRMSAELATSPP